MSLSNYKAVPTQITPFNHQIAGHGSNNRRGGKFLMDGPSIVLKPLQTDERGSKEVAFYQQVFNSTGTDEKFFLEIREFLPSYKGIYYSDEQQVYYLGLENAMRQLTNPSIMDLKIGKISYDIHASQEKRQREIEKYPFRESVGFLITGFKMYYPDEKKEIVFESSYGRKLDYEGVYQQGILLFLGKELPRAKKLANLFIKKLNRLLLWFEKQKRFNFIASSILLAYGDVSNPTNDDDVVVKWVDFTHTFDANKTDSIINNHEQQRDENFIFGLCNLIKMLKRVVEEENCVGGGGCGGCC